MIKAIAMSALIGLRTGPNAHRPAGPVLTPTQRPGLLAALERLLQRAQWRLGAATL